MRVRFLPATFEQLLVDNKPTFFYYYDQVYLINKHVGHHIVILLFSDDKLILQILPMP